MNPAPTTDLAQERAERRRRRPAAAANHVELVVEDEQVARRAGLGVSDGLEHLDGIDVEEAAEDFVHREEGRRHAAGAGEERRRSTPSFLLRAFGQLVDAGFDALLLCLSEERACTRRWRPSGSGPVREQPSSSARAHLAICPSSSSP